VFTKRILGAFFVRYTTTTAYLRAVANGTQRHDLDGLPVGEIAPEHRQAAQEELDRRFAMHAQRRQQNGQPGRPGQGPARGPGRGPAGPGRGPVGAGGVAAAGGEAAASTDGGGARPARAPRQGVAADEHERVHAKRPPLKGRSRQIAEGEVDIDAAARSTPRHAPRNQGGHGAGGQGAHTGRRDGGGRDARADFGSARASSMAPSPSAPAGPSLAALEAIADPERRERALLLRAYEASTLTAANFCALKRIDPKSLEPTLALARRERDEMKGS
jgi:hypothetical protein